MRSVFGSLVFLLVFPCAALAQSSPAGESAARRVFVDLNLVDTGKTLTGPRNFRGLFVRFAEQGSFDATYPEAAARTAVPLDLAVGFFVHPRLAVGLGVARTQRAAPASVSVRIPHPTVFNVPGTATGLTGPLNRAETAARFLMTAVLAKTGRIEWRLSGGPSLFEFDAEMVHSVIYTQDAPTGIQQNAVSIDGVVTARARARTWGVFAGSDVAVLVHPHLAITGGARVSSAIVKVASEPLSGLSQDLRIGRKSVLLGLRIFLKNAR